MFRRKEKIPQDMNATQCALFPSEKENIPYPFPLLWWLFHTANAFLIPTRDSAYYVVATLHIYIYIYIYIHICIYIHVTDWSECAWGIQCCHRDSQGQQGQVRARQEKRHGSGVAYSLLERPLPGKLRLHTSNGTRRIYSSLLLLLVWPSQ